ncbi:Crp/Fnr family transcriptional regulator, partial [Ruminococcus sp. TM09-4]
IYKDIMKESAPVANYTNELMATRFSDVMWLIKLSRGKITILDSKRLETLQRS